MARKKQEEVGETKEYLKKKLVELKNAAQQAINEIISEIEEPIDKEVSQEKRRNITRGKREAVEDVQTIMMAIQELDERINEGSSDDGGLLKKKKDFNRGHAERRAKQ